VDGRALLQLVRHPVRGVFVNYVDHDRPHLFARPSPPSDAPKIHDGSGHLFPSAQERSSETTKAHTSCSIRPCRRTTR
jgi:hypothetical protein